MAEVGACRVAEVMGTELYTLTPGTAAAAAQRIVLENGIDHLLVLDNGTLAGIVCKDDLCDAAQDALVGECMSSPVLCIGPDTTLLEAAQIMCEQQVSCLPVVTGAYLVGIVTRAALATVGFAAAPDGEPADEACSACGSTVAVHRDARVGDVPLCAPCHARWSPNAQPTGRD